MTANFSAKISNKIASIGGRIATFMGENNDYGLGEDSTTKRQLNNALSHHSIQDFLPYRSYDPDSKLFFNEHGAGFVMECYPMVGNSEAMQREISGLFQTHLPEGSNIQFMLWADPRIGDILDKWQNPRSQTGGIYAKLAQQRVQFLRNQVFAADKAVPIRDFRCFVSVSIEGMDTTRQDKTKMMRVRSQVITALETLGLPVKALNADDLINLLDGIINFNDATDPSTLTWNPYDNINRQIPSSQTAMRITSDGISFNEDEYIARCYSVRKEPEYWSLFSMGELIGDLMSDRQINTPFLLHYGIKISDQDKTSFRIQKADDWVEKQAMTKIGKKIPIIKKQSRELSFVRDQKSAGERFVQTNFSVVLFSKGDEIYDHHTSLDMIFRSNRWQLQPERFLHLQILLSCLPMSWGEGYPAELYVNKRLKTTLSSESANLLPLQGEWKGTGPHGMILSGRRGQLFTWNPFDNNEGNYNVCAVGRSGSGKSVFMQELVTSVLGRGGRAIILDLGRSFEKMALLLGGDYIQFTPDCGICINPFTTIAADSENKTLDALAMLKPVISSMASPRGDVSDLENALIEKAIGETWKLKGNDACISDVANYLSEQSSGLAKDLASKLYPYTSDGIYGRFFNGVANINFKAQLVVCEFEALKERKDLQNVIVQMVILQVTNSLFSGDRKTESIICLEELWHTGDSPQLGAITGALSRTVRKYNTSLVVGTQSVNDFFDYPALKAVFDNADWMCLLSQKKESIEQLKKSNRLSLDAMMETMITSVRTKQGQYSEVMIYGSQGYSIGRLVLDPFSRVLYSTKASEFTAVQDFVNQGLSMTDAVAAVAQRFGGK